MPGHILCDFCLLVPFYHLRFVFPGSKSPFFPYLFSRPILNYSFGGLGGRRGGNGTIDEITPMVMYSTKKENSNKSDGVGRANQR